LKVPINVSVNLNAEAAESLCELIQSLESLKEDMPWRTEIDEAIDAAISIGNSMVIVRNGMVTGKLKVGREL
jgi:hypothetical protein